MEGKASHTFHIERSQKQSLLAEVEKVVQGNPYLVHEHDEGDGKIALTIVGAKFETATVQQLTQLQDQINTGQWKLPSAETKVNLFD